MAEGGGLLNRYTLSRRIEGSNPSVSAKSLFATWRQLILLFSNQATENIVEPALRLWVPAKVPRSKTVRSIDLLISLCHVDVVSLSFMFSGLSLLRGAQRTSSKASLS